MLGAYPGGVQLSDGSTLAQPVSLSQLGLPPEAGDGGLGAAGTAAGLSLGADGVSQASIAQMSLLQQQAQLQAAQRSQQPFFFPQTPGAAPASEAPAPPGAAAYFANSGGLALPYTLQQLQSGYASYFPQAVAQRPGFALPAADGGDDDAAAALAAVAPAAHLGEPGAPLGEPHYYAHQP